jgi:hypothetical protein
LKKLSRALLRGGDDTLGINPERNGVRIYPTADVLGIVRGS